MSEFAIAVTKRKVVTSAAHRTARAAIAPLLEPGCSITGINKGQFSLIDLIRVILAHVGPAELTITTWTPGIAEIDEVSAMVRASEVTGFRMLVDRSFVSRHKKYVNRVNAAIGEQAIIQTRTHAKFALIKAGDWRITIRTSMNFNRNIRWEQFDIDDNPEVYGFYEQLIDDAAESAPSGLLAPQKWIERAFYRQRVPGTVIRMTLGERRS